MEALPSTLVGVCDSDVASIVQLAESPLQERDGGLKERQNLQQMLQVSLEQHWNTDAIRPAPIPSSSQVAATYFLGAYLYLVQWKGST